MDGCRKKKEEICPDFRTFEKERTSKKKETANCENFFFTTAGNSNK